MFCSHCGSPVSEGADYCPHCGEIIGKDGTSSKEPSVISNALESDLNLSLLGEEIIKAFPKISKKIHIAVQNLSSRSIPEVEVRLFGPAHIRIFSPVKNYGEIGSTGTYDTITKNFVIRPREIGNFSLTATLKSQEGHSLVYSIPIEVQARTPSTYRDMSQGRAGLIGILLLGILLIFGGIGLFFIGLSSFAITLIVIGVIMVCIGSRGRCICLLAFCDCDC